MISDYFKTITAIKYGKIYVEIPEERISAFPSPLIEAVDNFQAAPLSLTLGRETFSLSLKALNVFLFLPSVQGPFVETANEKKLTLTIAYRGTNANILSLWFFAAHLVPFVFLGVYILNLLAGNGLMPVTINGESGHFVSIHWLLLISLVGWAWVAVFPYFICRYYWSKTVKTVLELFKTMKG